MQAKQLWLGTLGLALSTSLLAAEGVNNTFVQLDYGMGSFKVEDFDSIDTTSYELEGSWQAMSQLLLRGSWANTEEDEDGFDGDFDTLKAGISWLAPTEDDNVAIDVGLRYREDDDGDESFDGIGVGFGVRVMAGEHVELSGRFDWLEGDYDGSVDAEIGAAWHFTDLLAVNFAYEQLDFKSSDFVNYKDRQWQLGVRLSF